jgi:hypothetical protein
MGLITAFALYLPLSPSIEFPAQSATPPTVFVSAERAVWETNLRSRILTVPEGTVASWLSRGRAALRRELDQDR